MSRTSCRIIRARPPLPGGGAPSAFDRFLGTRLGAAAVEHLHAGQRGVMVGMVEDEIVTTPLAEATACTRSLEEEYFELARMLAR